MNILRIVVKKKYEYRQKSNVETSVFYDVEGISRNALIKHAEGVLFVNMTDDYQIFDSEEDFVKSLSEHYLIYALKRGQFDQRADAAEQCLRLRIPGSNCRVKSYHLAEAKSREALDKVLINPVDTDILTAAFPKTLAEDGEQEKEEFTMSSSMSDADRALIDEYFLKEGRKPTETELRVLDTYWSDHCRHTTFNTELKNIVFDEDPSNRPVREAFDAVHEMRAALGRGERPMSLMELATIDAKYQRSKGRLEDLDVSEEINACSIKRKVTDCKGNKHDYLIMFKNETHNHPTEIEPFGGAATCIGGAIRDPLSGRSYVYNGVRLTGAGDPYMERSELLPGKLMQQDICRLAAAGFSSYGNQIGVATGLVDEVYHRDYRAKRFEAGAVMAAVPEEHVRRERPAVGDKVILIGGRTGRDGVGGATGSSGVHTDKSLAKSGAEVQKGNAPEERKLQRLFSKKEFATKVKRCNDFGAGGVSVAVGELADSLDIYLDRVPLKYRGLNPTEIAVSESQERMAIVVSASDVDAVRKMCDEENAESTVVADVTDSGRVRMFYGDRKVMDISRAFIDTNGAKTEAELRVGAIAPPPRKASAAIRFRRDEADDDCFFTESSSAKRGLIELFDCSVGSATVLNPFGGKYQASPSQVAVAKVPVYLKKGDAESMTASMMAYGFNPDMSSSPFYMGMYSVLESVAKIVAAGGNADSIRLSLQEFFPRMKADNWNLPFEALLGAGTAMRAFQIAAIGGKDSMSGNYEDISVPPTLASFAVTTEEVDRILTTDFKGGQLYLVGDYRDDEYMYVDKDGEKHCFMPDFKKIREEYAALYKFAGEGKISSAFAIGVGGVAAAAAKMGFGNGVGADISLDDPFDYRYGAILVESLHELPFKKIGKSLPYSVSLKINGKSYALSGLEEDFFGRLQNIYPSKKPEFEALPELCEEKASPHGERIKLPVSRLEPVLGAENVRVFVPVFPGTNSELDMAREFRMLGCKVDSYVLVNKTEDELRKSIEEMEKLIDSAHILVLSGGFSAGDEPDGSAKFIASVFRNGLLSRAVHDLIDRKGLIIGICNGFQALTRLGLIPNGRISEQSVVLDYNESRRHIAKVSPVRIVNTDSPWLRLHKPGDIVMTAFSHGEGRLRGPGVKAATEYLEKDFNGSEGDVEGALAAKGQIFGKMGHIERVGIGLYKNVPYSFDTKILRSGVEYCVKTFGKKD